MGIIIAQAVPLGILFGPMMCGIFLCYLTHMRGKPTDFGMLFKGFDYFLESFLATLIIMGVSIVVYLPLLCVLFAVIFGAVAAAGGGGDEAAAAFPLVIGLFYLAALLLNIVLTAVFAFVYPLIVDRDMKAVPAVRASVGAAWANIGGMLGLICLLFVVLPHRVYALCHPRDPGAAAPHGGHRGGVPQSLPGSCATGRLNGNTE